ncbi:two-component regulator propeller domain-containing protein, partial [Flavobacterium sp. A45]|uniref:ligand-binding sensor domain-containing protein n=1 Tax=Flavobacterium sp. A45 TaxID=1945862 RepID=UPI0009C82905
NEHLVLGRENIIWFSTYDNIYMLKAYDHRFKKHLQFKNFQVSTRNIVSDKVSNLYVGSYKGLYKLNIRNNSSSKIYDTKYPLNYYNSILINKGSTLWTEGQGRFIKSINLYSGKIKTITYKGNEDLHSTFIKQKSKDSIWMGSDKGLFIFNIKTEVFQRYKIGRNDTELTVYDILKDSRKTLWIATDKGLYYKKISGNFEDYSNTYPYFRNKIILVLHEDKYKNLWVGTNNAGVACVNLKANKIAIYDQLKGLSNNTVCGILESDDQMWFSTFYGLSVLYKKINKFNNYYIQNGLSENEFNKRSFFKRNDSSLYFGGLNGITELNPKQFNFIKKSYNIYISKKEYFSNNQNKYIIEYGDTATNIELPYDKNYFSAEFSINDLYDYDKSIFYYRIKGLANGWTLSGASGQVKLYNIPSGNYVLEVKGKNLEGFETENKIKLKIHVEQVFYKTPYFLAIIIL